MVFGNPALRTLLLFGWLADFCIVPEGLAAPLWAVLILWAPAGAGGADQLAAAAAFVQSLAPQGRARAFGLAQSGLLAVQGPGHPGRRRRGQLHRGPVVVGLADLLGLCAAASSRWPGRCAAVT